ncbi:MAG: phosphotransacetylase family protein [Anaerolineales bacterium]|nr:MAG: phosphotransacetylase family protein [Anaerolineales bacterium]
MKSLYITSVESYSGKTAVCLSLGRYLQGRGLSVGYLKPVSTQPWRSPAGILADEDAVFVHSALGLEGDAAEASPVIITPATLREYLKGIRSEDLVKTIEEAAKRAGKSKDLLLLEGGASLREGYAIGLSNLRVAEVLGAPALVVVPYRGEMSLVDDVLTARFRLGERLFGVVLNRVPEGGLDFVKEYAIPFLEAKGIRIFGALPIVPRLSALSVGEIIELLGAEVLTKNVDPNALAETLTVGAMTAEAALSRFRRYQNKAVITGGDRTDIQLAALETSTVLMILTGNLHPSPLIIQQAEALNVPILLVKQNTMETIELVERSLGKTRLSQPEKMETFLNLMIENVQLETICEMLDLCA